MVCTKFSTKKKVNFPSCYTAQRGESRADRCEFKLSFMYSRPTRLSSPSIQVRSSLSSSLARCSYSHF